ncbi:TPA: DNA primase, partial [Klebsiella pneumoniae]|nr:DNA primase [Klebsiella pneumoniae]
MKNAPNVKTLPKDKMEEAIIFAGTGAWKAAKAYQTEQGEGGDAIPPVVLDHTQLTELPHLRIVDKGRRFARVYQAGLIEQNHISMIANKLQEAGVTNAEYINEKGEKEDWTALMSRIEKQPLTVVDRGGATL